MNVAIATSTGTTPSSFMTAHNGSTVVAGPGTQIPPNSYQAEEPLVNRFPLVAFKMDSDVERLVMLFRDPASGVTIDQIPSEAALRQYKEAQLGKDAASDKTLTMTIGGDERGTSTAPVSEKSVSQRRKAVATGARDLSAPAHLAATNHAAAAPSAPVSVRPAASSGPRLNMVI